MRTISITEDEIANAAGMLSLCFFVMIMRMLIMMMIVMLCTVGMGDVHDGVNFMRSACVIAVEKAQATFEPMLEVRERKKDTVLVAMCAS